MQTRQTTYLKFLTQEKENLSDIRKQITRISLIRFSWFCAIAVLIWASRHLTIAVPISEGIIGIVGFLILVVKYNKLLQCREYCETRIILLQKELNLIDYKFDEIDDTAEEKDGEHPFTNDLDVFGDHSLFQYLNRSISGLGREKLIEWLKSPLTDKTAIEIRQQAVGELSDKSELRLHFATTGLMQHNSIKDREELVQFFRSENLFLGKTGITRTTQILPFVNIGLLTAATFGVLPYSFFTILFLLTLGIAGIYTKRINDIHNVIGKKLSLLGSYEKLFHQILCETFEAKHLTDIQNQLTQEGHNPLQILRKLNRQAEHLNQRTNMLVGIFLNGILLWDIRTVLKIERTKTQTATLLPEWLNAVSDFDALCSLATFRYNHPDSIFPEIDECDDQIMIEEMKYPLMHREKSVQNNLHIPTTPYFIIITGANMAGKSTYLRTLGVNYLLACIGAPVCATRMKLQPASLATSLKTTDSLAKNESYFFAELKRLQSLIHRLEQGERLFIVLDEILKGTNSTDKQKGSLALVARLLNLGGTGIIATHDLLLGSLAEAFPDQVRNFRFEADIHDNTLSFSYKMQPGIAQNMNACFLMEQMGIIGKQSPEIRI